MGENFLIFKIQIHKEYSVKWSTLLVPERKRILPFLDIIQNQCSTDQLDRCQREFRFEILIMLKRDVIIETYLILVISPNDIPHPLRFRHKFGLEIERSFVQLLNALSRQSPPIYTVHIQWLWHPLLLTKKSGSLRNFSDVNKTLFQQHPQRFSTLLHFNQGIIKYLWKGR